MILALAFAFVIVAMIFLLLAACNVPTGRVSMIWLGLVFLALSTILGKF